MKNKLIDLNNHLFAQLERLADEDLTSEQIDIEVKRADAIVKVSDQIVGAAQLHLKGAQLIAQHGAFLGRHMPGFVAGPLAIGDGKTTPEDGE